MANQGNQIEFLPPGWVWVGKGKGSYSYVNSSGKTVISNERHGLNTNTGETISLRQVQNRQRTAREQIGIPKPPSVTRKLKTRTIKHKGSESTLYSEERHGKSQSLVFRSLTDARNYVFSNPLPNNFLNVAIQIRYTEKLVSNKPGSDQASQKNGYATLTRFGTANFFNVTSFDTTPSYGDIPNPWELAKMKINEYDMTGSKARVYIYMSER